jgi:hypothetical protein
VERPTQAMSDDKPQSVYVNYKYLDEESKWRSFQVAAISCNRCSPHQIVFTPGLPSPLRPKKPPRLAIIRTAACKDGGVSGGIGF